MKSLKNLMFVAAGMTALSAGATVVPADSLAVRWNGSESVTVNMSLDAGGETLRRNSRVILTPQLVGADGNVVTLPAVEFATRRNRKYNDRIAALEELERNSVYSAGDTVEYSQTVPAEEWMLRTPLTLRLVREKESCCNITLLSEDNIAQSEYVSPYVPVVAAVAPARSVSDMIAEKEPLLCPYSEYRPFDRSIPLASMKGALFVHFKVNKSDIDTAYRDNREVLDRIVSIMQGVSADTASAVMKIRVVGLSSPEGPVGFNERLSLKRAQALKEYVDARVSMPEEAYEVIAAGEAWADLEYAVENSDIAEKEELLSILREVEDPVERERLLRKFNGGKAFDYLKQQVFVDQRNSGYIQVYYETAPDAGAEAINRAVELVDAGKYDEAIGILEELDDDRKFNTLATAYFMAGRKSEAIDCFRKAASAGDEDARKNLENIE